MANISYGRATFQFLSKEGEVIDYNWELESASPLKAVIDETSYDIYAEHLGDGTFTMGGRWNIANSFNSNLDDFLSVVKADPQLKDVENILVIVKDTDAAMDWLSSYAIFIYLDGNITIYDEYDSTFEAYATANQIEFPVREDYEDSNKGQDMYDEECMDYYALVELHFLDNPNY